MKFLSAVRLGGRIGIAALVLAVAGLIGIQAERVVARNAALSHELATVQANNAALRVKRAKQLRHIRRLSDPRGAITEIHDRLRMIGGREELIYVKGLATPAPAWEDAP